MTHRISVRERRARLVARHHLDRSAVDALCAVHGVVALHSSDPLTPHLALRARVPNFRTEDLERALNDDRTLWRLHAMRRTLFVVSADEAEVFHAGAGRDVARRERRRLRGWLEAEMDPEAVTGWVDRLESRVLETLADGREMGTRELSAAIPELATKVTLGSGKWTARSPLSSRLLFLMALDGRIVRTRPAGSWRSSQYGWAAVGPWFERDPVPLDPAAGRAALARRYLGAFGPATLVDLRWWTGWTAKQVTAAVRTAGGVTVDLESGGEGILLPENLECGSSGPGPRNVVEAREPDAPVVTLLPGLDPTPMGWKERGWFLGKHADRLFDRNGNVGPTIWLDGRIVGGWAQRAGGEVVHRVLEDVGSEASERIAAEAAALGEWMDGEVAIPRFRTPLERELAG